MNEDKAKDLRSRLIDAGYEAVEELILVAKERIIDDLPRGGEDDDQYQGLAADRLKNAAAAKKLAIFDAFEILNRIESEKAALTGDEDGKESKEKSIKGFAEQHSKQSLPRGKRKDTAADH